MSAPVVWILAFASAFLLIAGGFTVAVARFRSKVVAKRRHAAKLGAQLESRPVDPFGELQVIGDQLRKIQQRLGQAEEVAGLPVQSSATSAASAAPKPGAPVTAELEQDLDLFKNEVYNKTQRIDALVTEKQVLAEKIVALENALAAAPAPKAVRKPKPTESTMALVDVLQQEADELRARMAEQEGLLKSLEKSDTSGMVKEVSRIRAELLERNNEVMALNSRVADSGPHNKTRSRVAALEMEKEELTARLLEAAAQVRRSTARISELEQAMVSNQAMAFAGAAKAPPAPASSAPAAGAPRVPMPKAPSSRSAPPPPLLTPPPRSKAAPPPPRSNAKSPPPRTTAPAPPPRSAAKAPPPRTTAPAPPPRTRGAPPPPPQRQSRGFPDEPTIKSPPPKITPPPRGKKDLLD